MGRQARTKRDRRQRKVHQKAWTTLVRSMFPDDDEFAAVMEHSSSPDFVREFVNADTIIVKRNR